MVTFQYDAKVPASVQWEVGHPDVAAVGDRSLDVSYVGNHGYNRLGGFQNGTTVNLNAIDFGAAYLPQNQDLTLGAERRPGRDAYTTNLLRPYPGSRHDQPEHDRVLGHVPLDSEQR